jgi:hypothetical protein
MTEEHLTRTEAINLLAQSDLQSLTVSERESLLLDLWNIDENDSEFAELPTDLKAEMAEAETPTDPTRAIYTPLLLVGLRDAYVGVTNSFLEKRYSALTGRPARVQGAVELLFACACCGYRTLRTKGEYDICPVCYWEDDGSDDSRIDRHSGPNHMTLRRARINFAKLGAKREDVVRFALRDGPERYMR